MADVHNPVVLIGPGWRGLRVCRCEYRAVWWCRVTAQPGKGGCSHVAAVWRFEMVRDPCFGWHY